MRRQGTSATSHGPCAYGYASDRHPGVHSRYPVQERASKICREDCRRSNPEAEPPLRLAGSAGGAKPKLFGASGDTVQYHIVCHDLGIAVRRPEDVCEGKGGETECMHIDESDDTGGKWSGAYSSESNACRWSCVANSETLFEKDDLCAWRSATCER